MRRQSNARSPPARNFPANAHQAARCVRLEPPAQVADLARPRRRRDAMDGVTGGRRVAAGDSGELGAAEAANGLAFDHQLLRCALLLHRHPFSVAWTVMEAKAGRGPAFLRPTPRI